MNTTTIAPKAAILDAINPAAHERFTEAGFEVGQFQKSLALGDLARELGGVQLLGIRSGPRLPGGLLEQARDLQAIGCYCVGTDQIDKKVATERGMAIFNSPFDNGRSVAELVIGATFTLLRRLHEHNRSLHGGLWTKTEAESYELKGKTMGIIGYGNIGQQVGVMAEQFGMHVLYTDLADRPRLGNAQTRTQDQLLAEADVVTIHVPGGLNKPVIGATELAAMKQGAYLINTARAQAVDYDELNRAIADGKLAGAALDVFPDEPAKRGDDFTTIFRGNDRVLLTPHIGGSTQEAQREAAETVTRKLLNYARTGATTTAINLPEVDLGPQATDTRITFIHQDTIGAEGALTSVLKRNKANIAAGNLRTKDGIGYGIYDIQTDTNLDYLVGIIRSIDSCIRARVIKL